MMSLKVFISLANDCCRDVTRFDGARGKKQVWCPMFEPEVFRKQMYCIEENICDIVGTFRRPPQSFGALVVTRRPGIVTPFAPLLHPCLLLKLFFCNYSRKCSYQQNFANELFFMFQKLKFASVDSPEINVQMLVICSCKYLHFSQTWWALLSYPM